MWCSVAARARAGDGEALAALWGEEARYVLGVADRLGARWAWDAALEREDVRQEGFLAFHELLHRWDPAGPLAFGVYLAWWYPKTLNGRLRRLTDPTQRRALREADAPAAAEPDGPDEAPRLFDLGGYAAGPEVDAPDRIVCRAALARLPAPQRQLLLLHLGAGFPLTVAQRRLAIPPNTAARWVKQALAKLRRWLDHERTA